MCICMLLYTDLVGGRKERFLEFNKFKKDLQVAYNMYTVNTH